MQTIKNLPFSLYSSGGLGGVSHYVVDSNGNGVAHLIKRPGETNDLDAKTCGWLFSAAPDLHKAYGRLHDMLSDMIESGRLSEADIPDDYQALVEQLAGPCAAAMAKVEGV